MGNGLVIRAMRRDEWEDVAELIHLSTNYWYEANRHLRIFTCPPEGCMWFCKVYEALDPGCCLVARDVSSGRLVGSCFYHPRSTHVSLGIMNAHPGYFGRGVASRLLARIVEIAHERDLPVRLVSSAMNLDSFSLYNRAGFVPRQLYQDMYLPKGVAGAAAPGLAGQVREARLADVPALVSLERELAGLDRQKDYDFFIRNEQGIWHTLVLEESPGRMAGFLVSVNHPSSNMLGPGVMRDVPSALALIYRQLEHHAGRTPVFLAPTDRPELLEQVYKWGGRNCEIHMHNVLGRFPRMQGINMPTFMPETA